MSKRTTAERFAAKHQPTESGCSEWKAARTRDGYGSFWMGEYRQTDPLRSPVMVLAHRWAYEHHVGPIPAGMNVCHHCDNPPCVNPSHLFLGTQRANVHDCIQKGRHYFGRRILTPEEVAMIRSRYRGEYGDLARLSEQIGATRRLVASVVRDLPRRGRLAR